MKGSEDGRRHADKYSVEGEKILANPVPCDWRDNRNEFSESLRLKFKNKAPLTDCVEPISNWDVLDWKEQLARSHTRLLQDMADWEDIFGYDGDAPPESFLTPWHCTEIYLNFRDPLVSVYFVVDLEATDSAILEEMKRQICIARETKGHLQRTSKITDSMMRSWCGHMILPCIDPTYWARKNRVKLSHVQLADWLFPGSDVDRTEKLRKTTLRIIQEIWTQNFVWRLYTEAGRDALSRLNKNRSTAALENAEKFLTLIFPE